MSFLYETHLHTSVSSACASSRGYEYVRRYMDLGYSGIFVTDHFYNGNTAVPHSLPWKDWVNRFCLGYEEAKNEGDKNGFDVFFGWEETFNGCDDYLVYGLDKAWLLEHPEMTNWTRGEQYKAVKEAGGCVVQAHPFRQADWIRRIVLSSGCVDAVETANAGNWEQSYDALAMRYAQKLNLPYTAGSDMHNARGIEKDRVFGVILNKKLNSAGDYVNAILNNDIEEIKIPDGRCDFYGNEQIRLPLELRDKNDKKNESEQKKMYEHLFLR